MGKVIVAADYGTRQASPGVQQAGRLGVTREGHPFDGPMYVLRIGNEVKHVDADPYAMIRALGHYIHSLSYQRPLGGV